MDLQDPGRKMSKSSESPHATIRLTDSSDVIRAKICSAVTDSGREVKTASDKPAISNLLTIYSIATDTSMADAEHAYAGKCYAQLKKARLMPWWNICRRFGRAMSRRTRNRNKSAMCFAAVRRTRERVHANTRCGLRPRRFSASLRVAEVSASVRTYPRGRLSHWPSVAWFAFHRCFWTLK
jgi:hypothetical protein